MAENEIARALAQTLRHTFGDLLDQPLLARLEAAATGTSPASALDEYSKKIRYCEACSLHIGRGKLVFGRGHWGSRIAFIGDFPSDVDDKSGEPFSGVDGELLNKMILAMKIRPEESYLTNIYKCRASATARVDASHFLACQTHLIYQFTQVRAPVIVAMGEAASRALSRSEAPLQVLRKQVFEWQGRQVIPTHHPREIHNNPALKKETWEDLQSAMRLIERAQ